ncbi:hypothetical protein DPMN_131316 [Dreissena polymorpha]|uniref:Uncharacterized protein n=1 Tax=Dreissena polymorpha TaxID=45954 RepID=A0A9D4H873_DREPO|nr:hypothetical protein DPMN_131316 [Dreissena polymorpha]
MPTRIQGCPACLERPGDASSCRLLATFSPYFCPTAKPPPCLGVPSVDRGYWQSRH